MLQKAINKKRPGFTLLEILLVVAAIGILAGIVIVAINPNKQLADTRNAERKVDVNTILNAVYQYSIDNGSLPGSIGNGAIEICKTGTTCSGLVDLTVLVSNEKYLVAIPVDPSANTSANGTGYQIFKDANNRVTVSAPNAENGQTISVSR